MRVGGSLMTTGLYACISARGIECTGGSGFGGLVHPGHWHMHGDAIARSSIGITIPPGLMSTGSTTSRSIGESSSGVYASQRPLRIVLMHATHCVSSMASVSRKALALSDEVYRDRPASLWSSIRLRIAARVARYGGIAGMMCLKSASSSPLLVHSYPFRKAW